jgi:hypothetical protein
VKIKDKIDFVYIDGNHSFKATIHDIVNWGKKVKRGGIIAGHDYDKKYKGVRNAVNAYVAAYEIKDWYLLKGRYTTYFWVKDYDD